MSDDSGDHISLRLISALDFIEDRFVLPIVLISGYRSQEYNDNLRAKGGGAARASLHIEGMAADIHVRKNLAAKIWGVVKEMGCCGIGFYGGDSIHIDTGPARYWTQATSKVRTNVSENNKSIMVRTDQDIYLPGEKVEVKLARVTAYPVSVIPTFSISGEWRITSVNLLLRGKMGPAFRYVTRQNGHLSGLCHKIFHRKEKFTFSYGSVTNNSQKCRIRLCRT